MSRQIDRWTKKRNQTNRAIKSREHACFCIDLDIDIDSYRCIQVLKGRELRLLGMRLPISTVPGLKLLHRLCKGSKVI